MERIYREFYEAGTMEAQRLSETSKKYFDNKISITRSEVKESENISSYFTFQIRESLFCYQELQDALILCLKDAIAELLKKHNYKSGKKVLAIGLGNEKMTADSLGAITVSGLHITRHIIEDNLFDNKKMPNLSAIKSSVSGLTGLNSFDIITGVIEKTKPDFVIAIDTLACKGVERLGRAIQLTDIGIEPGGGVNNPKTRLNESSLGVPVIAVGVPLVIYATNILREYIIGNNDIKVKSDSNLQGLVVTSKDIDIVVADFAYVLARAINESLSA